MNEGNFGGIPYKKLRKLIKDHLKRSRKKSPLETINVGNGLVHVDSENWTWTTPAPEGGFPYIVEDNGGIAQVVEHQTENLSVGGANPSPTTKCCQP